VKYSVIQSPRASADLAAAAFWIAEDSPVRAMRWLEGISAHILQLSDFPMRCSVISESREFSVKIRQTIFGRSRGSSRILFTIEAETVIVLRVRHAMRATLTAEEIESLAWED
jgi:plasmid stabilization system protein ParE